MRSHARRALDRDCDRLLQLLKASDVSSAAALLGKHSDPEILVRLRERKALLKADAECRSHVAELLRTTADRLLRSPEREVYERYIAFAIAYAAAEQNIRLKAVDLVERLPPVSLPDLLNAAQTVFRRLVRKIEPRGPRTPQRSVALDEHALHERNGALNDLASALARGVNEVAKFALRHGATPLGRGANEKVAKLLERITLVAIKWNALDWAFDCVSFGELSVASIPDERSECFDLEQADPRLSLIRLTAIRRSLVSRYVGNRQPRYVRDTLAFAMPTLLARAADFYGSAAAAAGAGPPDAAHLRERASFLLVHVDAEDDLLMAATGSDAAAATHYTLAFALRCFATVASELRRSDPMRYHRRLACPSIPLDLIRSMLPARGGISVGHAVDAFTTDLPTRSHHDLLTAPFLRDGPDVVRPFLEGDFGTWPTSVRERLITGGAAGDAVGKIWEKFYAESFAGSDWTIVGRSIKLRHQGKFLTDVDLMVARDDLLLVIQIKALIGSGATPYDHWRNRQTIELGCSQARIAVDSFDAQPERLVGIMGRKAAERVRKVQPTVLTNMSTFNGWHFDGVPVMGETTRKGITEGSKVDYRDLSGAIVSTHHFVSPEELSTGKILWLLDHPVELEIAPERFQTVWAEERFGSLGVRVARFALTDQPSPYEPHGPTA